jgi:MFS family permease
MASVSTKRSGFARRFTGAFRSGPLAVRDFRLLSFGQLASTVGDFCYAVALPWLVLSSPHGGPFLLGTVLACYGVPRTVLIPVGGVFADKFSPRAVMLAADTIRCVLVAVLAVVAARGNASIAFLGPVAALIGAGEGVFLPASVAIMPSLLPADSLQAGNGLSAAMIQIGSITGPVLGGILVVSFHGSTAAFALDSASFALSALALALMRGRRAATAAGGLQDPSIAPTSDGDVVPAESDGEGGAKETSVVRLFLHSRVLQVIVFVAVLANFVIAGAFEVALPALSHARFGASGYGALIACFGFGSLAGTLAAAKFAGLRRPAVAACLAFLIGAVAVSLVPFLGGLPGAAAADLVFGAGAGFGDVIIITLLQQWAPAHMLARVMSLVLLASFGAFPGSVALSGVIVDHIGPAPFFPASAAVLGIAVLLALTQSQFRRFGAASAPAAPETAVV